MVPSLPSRDFEPSAHHRPRPTPKADLTTAECRRLGHATFRLLENHLVLPRPPTVVYSSEACLALLLLADLVRASPEHAAREARVAVQLLPHGKPAHLPSADTAFLALRAISDSDLLAALQDVLDEQIRTDPPPPPDQPLLLAGDCHDILTYHKTPKRPPRHPRPSRALRLALRRQPERGTDLAFRFLTFVTTRGTPRTVTADPVLPLEALAPKLTHALDTATHRLGRTPDLLLYDAAAYGSEVVAALHQQRPKFIVRAPQNARIATLLRQSQGLLALALPNFPIRLHPNRADETPVTVTLVAVRRELLDRHDISIPPTDASTKWFVYATNLVPEDGEDEKPFALRVALLYKERWSVETSYRGIEELRGFTHALSYGPRLLLFFLAVILANLWALQRARSGEAWTKAEVALLLRYALLLVGFDAQRGVDGQEVEIPPRPVDPTVPFRRGDQEAERPRPVIRAILPREFL